ncbi:hypothetical protein ACSNOU_18320 [Acinetobacter oleivorans]|uniref:hypothetical protein n=1 Tax=Acinetobacter oleivorans TaxID=1148157 RepID=UPI003F1D5068
MSVGLSEILSYATVILLIIVLIREYRYRIKMIALNKRLLELEKRIVVRIEDRLTELEQETFYQVKRKLSSGDQ